MTVPPPETETSHNQTAKPRAWWMLLLPLLLGASIVFLQMQPQPTTDNSTTATPTPKPITTPQAAPQTTPTAQFQYSIPTTILVAGEDAKLHKKPFKNTISPNNGANLSAIHTQWINAVVQAAPELFPTGTKVKSVRAFGDAEPAQVDFNAAFNTPKFWSGETKTKLAIYSIVNTLAPIFSDQGRDVPVQILVDGKRLQTLGEFDVSEPIAPDYSLDSSSKTSTKSAVKRP